MTALYVIWAVMVVPTFALFAHYAMQWAHEDLEEVTNNDKLGIYAMSGLMALGWPILAILLAVKGINNYIDGLHG